MIEQALQRLNFIIDKVPNILTQLSEDKISEKTTPDKWSKKEIIGHLIDSAVNNHQFFVRGQFEAIPKMRYDQDQWNAYSYYQQIDSRHLISFWSVYNKQLTEIMTRIPIANLKRQINFDDNQLTIAHVFHDYVEHVEHHLKQIIAY